MHPANSLTPSPGQASAGHQPPIHPRAAKEAALWLARLHSGSASEADQLACRRWRAGHAENERAWQRAELLGRTLGLIPAQLGMSTLDRPQSAQRRAALKTLVTLMTAGPLAWASYRVAPWQEWLADESTAVGMRREVLLPDGTRVLLNTASAIDVAFDNSLRLIRLRAGEIFVETAADPEAVRRPFVVQSDDGRIQALGTRFGVRRDDDPGRTRVSVFEGAVRIRPRSAPAAAVVVSANEQSCFTATGAAAAQALDPHAGAWIHGTLYAENMRLADFAAELSRYRTGLLRVDPAVADLRISGAFQLNDSDKILRLVQRSLPLRISYRTPYWVTLLPA